MTRQPRRPLARWHAGHGVTAMIRIRRSDERGHADHGWLDTRHTFSFADYHDPRQMGYRTLRVINDDRVAPGAGFPAHAHRDMEILTWVVEGALEHRDSLGNGSVIRPGDLQRMTAGTGVTHSERNPSPAEETRLLQIWILPERRGLAPGYAQRQFGEGERRNTLRLLASPDGAAGSVDLGQDVRLYGALLDEGAAVRHQASPVRGTWIQIVRGRVRLDGGTELAEGDGAAIEDRPAIELHGVAGESEILLFDLR